MQSLDLTNANVSPVYLVSLDERTDNIVVIAGEETVVVINPEGEVDYE
ncbi:DUF6888 family protein [uncultured Nostoc sp.]